MITLPELEKTKLIKWLVENKATVLAQKKSAVKLADSVNAVISFYAANSKDESAEKLETIPEEATVIKVRSIVNTTKLFDSHQDVHIDQLWNKSIKETKNNYLVKEHKFSFDGIISDNVKVFAKQMSWAELGYDYEGNTQALIYDSVISKAESPDMFARYVAGKVRQHSVGMRYVKIDLAVNDSKYEKEYAIWQKYFDDIANKEDVVENGYFYAVTEAKNIEGSAVVKGSNHATPTQSISLVKDVPLENTHQKSEPLTSTQTLELINKFYKPSKHI